MENIRHIGLVVDSIDKALRFYKDTLGLKIQGKTEEKGNFISSLIGMENIELKTLKLSADDNATRIELIEFIHPKSDEKRKNDLNILGLTHIALTVKNLDQLYKKMKTAGIRFNCPPILTANKKLKITYCRDFDGNFLELTEEL